jgi:hypothetical protein
MQLPRFELLFLVGPVLNFVKIAEMIFQWNAKRLLPDASFVSFVKLAKKDVYED